MYYMEAAGLISFRLIVQLFCSSIGNSFEFPIVNETKTTDWKERGENRYEKMERKNQ